MRMITKMIIKMRMINFNIMEIFIITIKILFKAQQQTYKTFFIAHLTILTILIQIANNIYNKKTTHNHMSNFVFTNNQPVSHYFIQKKLSMAM